jgi:uncharacterized protein (DUF2141 family)
MNWIFALFFSITQIISTNNGSMLTIKITGVPSDKGKIMIGVYNKKEGFRDEKHTYKNLTVNAVKGTMTVYIPDLPNGNYAIAVFHDANENGKLDKNFLGVPTEKYGFSNNAMGSFGPPDFEDCVVKVEGDKEISINLK